jgi:outer membrane immunogenic protein
MTHITRAVLALCLAAPAAASAQTVPWTGFTALPAFASPDIDPATGRWSGGYARLSTGFEVSSSKRFGTLAGPTIGFEGGKLWREGDIVYGVTGGFDYLQPFGSARFPAFGRIGYSRDLAAGLDVRVGKLLSEDVLVYARTGVSALNGTFRFGPGPGTPGFSRQDIVMQPSAGIGVEWAVTDKLSVGIEVGTSTLR